VAVVGTTIRRIALLRTVTTIRLRIVTIILAFAFVLFFSSQERLGWASTEQMLFPFFFKRQKGNKLPLTAVLVMSQSLFEPSAVFIYLIFWFF
jgi:hypothetical protein